MGTSLTPEFWERFTILLVVAVAVTVILAATLEHVADRLQRCRTHRATTLREHGPNGPDGGQEAPRADSRRVAR